MSILQPHLQQQQQLPQQQQLQQQQQPQPPTSQQHQQQPANLEAADWRLSGCRPVESLDPEPKSKAPSSKEKDVVLKNSRQPLPQQQTSPPPQSAQPKGTPTAYTNPPFQMMHNSNTFAGSNQPQQAHIPGFATPNAPIPIPIQSTGQMSLGQSVQPQQHQTTSPQMVIPSSVR